MKIKAEEKDKIRLELLNIKSKLKRKFEELSKEFDLKKREELQVEIGVILDEVLKLEKELRR